MINAAWGLGEAIVGGQAMTDTVVVDKASGIITKQKIAEKDVMTVCTEIGTQEKAVRADWHTQAVLSPAQAASLARIGVQIEELYGQPMDIEWALYGGCISVVQAHPITALPELPKPATEPQVTPTEERNPCMIWQSGYGDSQNWTLSLRTYRVSNSQRRIASRPHKRRLN